MVGKSLSDNQGKLIPWVLLTLGQRVIICTTKSIQLDIVILITVISKVLIFGLTWGFCMPRGMCAEIAVRQVKQFCPLSGILSILILYLSI